MEFPGMLGVGLYRLRLLLRSAPIATLGPLFGIIGARMSLDITRGRLGSAALELVIAPLIALSVSSVAQRDHAGPSSLLLFVLGSVSVVGASILLSRGISLGSGVIVVMGLRHLTVAAYAWAAIAKEPPVRHAVRFVPVTV